MASSVDFQQFAITLPGGNITPTVPQVNVTLRVTDAQTGAILFDFTGANAFSLWTAFGSLSTNDKRDVIEVMAQAVIRKKAGLL